MFTVTVSPRFYETDALGHVNNTVVARWFETAREAIFRIFCPDMDPKKLNLILARIEIDFVAQIYFGSDVQLKTFVEKIGNSSFTVLHEAWQNGKCVARGRAVSVHFDFGSQKSSPIPDVHRRQLEQHLVSA